MSRLPRATHARLLGVLRRAALPLLVAAIASGVDAPPASAAQRVETFPLPSVKGNVNLTGPVRLNKTTKLAATVMLPDGYDAQPERRWPVLYMLHGVGDNTGTWVDRKYGDLTRRAAGFDGIVVMPEGGRSYWLDWWLGGQRTGSNWGQYLLDEVIPTIEAKYRILPGRQHHAIGGLSMGGYGAMVLAAQLPTYFGSAVSLSGLLDLQTWGAEYLVPYFSRMSFTRTWGRPGGPYQRVSSPKALLDNLGRTRLYLTTGNGVVDPTQILDLTRIIAGGAAELGSWADAVAFERSARARNIPVELRFRNGVHTWLAWRRDVPHVLAWDVFAAPPATDSSAARPLTYLTMAGHGNAWGLGFRFDALPRTAVQFRRAGQVVSATGTGRVTITPGAADADASGNGSRPDCAFTASLPFTHTLPDGC